MKILLVSATYDEIKPIAENSAIKEKFKPYFFKCNISGKEVDIIVTGIGMTSTAYQMGKIICCNKYDYAFNFGIAGSFDKNIIIGEVVNVCHDTISELGAENEEVFLKFNELNIKINSIDNTIWKIENRYIINNPVIQELIKVKGVTVNTVHSNKNSIENILNLFSPSVETMEGAAFPYICNTEKIKCAQIRAISNYVCCNRNEQYWNKELAIENLNIKAFSILNTL